MPVTPPVSYPGVYVQEESSGVRTIVGVPTSVTAFLGRAQRGAVNQQLLINNFADFERKFGGLNAEYPMSYAVRDYYQNGGGTAIILRLYRKQGVNSGFTTFSVDNLKVESASQGEWGNQLRVTVDHDGITDEVAERYAPLKKGDLFNLTIMQVNELEKIISMEKFPNLSIKEGARRVDRVLEQQSNLLRIQKKANGSPDFPANEKRPAVKSDQKGTNGKNSAALKKDDFKGKKLEKTGIYALEDADIFNLLCIPPDDREGDTDPEVFQEAMQYCADRRAMLIVDPPEFWGANKAQAAQNAKDHLTDLGLSGKEARNAALFFRRVLQSDPSREGQLGTFVPCGIMAGVMARTDATRGIWKAPAGIDASLNGIQGLQANLIDSENGPLNQLGINCLRTFPVIGRVAWGARTLRGADQLADEYKYVPVRRLALFMEESLFRGLKWVVFEPNDEPLWSQIRLNVGAFMHNLFRQGAFQGQTKGDAYFVKCDKETTTQNDINLGIVNIWVGFAPLKPAEFVVLYLQQMAGQIEV